MAGPKAKAGRAMPSVIWACCPKLARSREGGLTKVLEARTIAVTERKRVATYLGLDRSQALEASLKVKSHQLEDLLLHTLGDPLLGVAGGTEKTRKELDTCLVIINLR